MRGQAGIPRDASEMLAVLCLEQHNMGAQRHCNAAWACPQSRTRTNWSHGGQGRAGGVACRYEPRRPSTAPGRMAKPEEGPMPHAGKAPPDALNARKVPALDEVGRTLLQRHRCTQGGGRRGAARPPARLSCQAEGSALAGCSAARSGAGPAKLASMHMGEMNELLEADTAVPPTWRCPGRTVRGGASACADLVHVLHACGVGAHKVGRHEGNGEGPEEQEDAGPREACA
jgi:hypothetical protein